MTIAPNSSTFVTDMKVGLVQITPPAGKTTGECLGYYDMHRALHQLRVQMRKNGGDSFRCRNGTGVKVRPGKVPVLKKPGIRPVMATVKEWWRFAFRKLKIGGGFKNIQNVGVNTNDATLAKSIAKPKHSRVLMSSARTSRFSSKAQKPHKKPPLPAFINNMLPVETPSSLGSVSMYLNIEGLPYQIQVFSNQDGLKKLDESGVLERVQNAKRITMGDLHGSFLKLFETLQLAGLIEVYGENAKAFIEKAKQLETLLDDHWRMKEWGPWNNTKTIAAAQGLYTEIKPLIETMTWKDDERQLVLLGDVIADRGPWDKITLDLLQQLTQDKPDRILSIVGNHDHFAADALRYYRVKGGLENYVKQVKQNNKHLLQRMGSLVRSIGMAQTSEQQDVLAKQYQWYLERSSLARYCDIEKTLFSHAPVVKKDIMRAIDALKDLGYQTWQVKKSTETVVNNLDAQQLKQIIADLNDAYKNCLNNNEPLPRAIARFLSVRNSLCHPSDVLYYENILHRQLHGHDYSSLSGSPFSLFSNAEHSDAHPFTVVNLDQTARKRPLPEDNPIFMSNISRLYIEE